jgi:type IV pilus assembly protein PilC
MQNSVYTVRNLLDEGKNHKATPRLKAQAWYEYEILANKTGLNIRFKNLFAIRKPVTYIQMASFCWQLSTMIEGGVPVTSAIDTIAEDIENPRFGQALKEVSQKIKRGQSFSDSAANSPQFFSKLFGSMILVGESSGSLPIVLRRLGEYYDNRDKLAKKIRSAIAYPLFVVGFISLIIILIMVFIIPKFRLIFKQIGGDLPAFTQAFMSVYDKLAENIAYTCIFLALTIGITTLYARTQRGYTALSRLALSVPLLGKIFSQAFVAMFCRTMSTLLATGVSIIEAFDILAGISGNAVIKSAVLQAKDRLVQGSSVSRAIGASRFFPRMVVKTIQIGEESGSLAKVLDKTSEYYERKVDVSVTTIISLLEPMMIITVGAIVMVVVIALYLPIFHMSDFNM